MMNLSEAQKNKIYRVVGISDSEYSTRLQHLGFYKNVEVHLLGVAPFFKDPMLFDVLDTKVALTCFEAKLVIVEEVDR